MMSPQSGAGNTGPVWFRWPPCRSPLSPTAGSSDWYGLVSELDLWQMRTFSGCDCEKAGGRKTSSAPTSAASVMPPASQLLGARARVARLQRLPLGRSDACSDNEHPPRTDAGSNATGSRVTVPHPPWVAQAWLVGRQGMLSGD